MSIREEEELIKSPRFLEVKEANSRGGTELVPTQVERKENRIEMESESQELELETHFRK